MTSQNPPPRQLLSLSEIFEKRIFRIPDYQRGYAWGKREVEAFWNDLRRMGNERKHYTGQLTVRGIPDVDIEELPSEVRAALRGADKPISAYFIVDGQQRLTTSVILIKCILDTFGPDEAVCGKTKLNSIETFLFFEPVDLPVYTFGYAQRGATFEFFKTEILGQESYDRHKATSLYTMNLAEARDYFRDQLKKCDLTTRQIIFEALTQRCLFDWSELVEGLNEFVVFETMNNRGKKVSNFELLKNRLIHLTTYLPDSCSKGERRTLRKKINGAWVSAYENLGITRNRALNDDDAFLRAHTILFFKRHWSASEFLFEEHFLSDRVSDGSLTYESFLNYAESLEASSLAWSQIHLPEKAEYLPDEIRLSLDRLRRLGHGAFVPILMAGLQCGMENVDALISAAERFRFAVSGLCKRKSNTGDTHFYSLAYQCQNEHIDNRAIIENINHWTDRHFNVEDAIRASQQRFERNEGFYSWNTMRFFLYEYEQYLRPLTSGTEDHKLSWTTLSNHKTDFVSVEHIFPQNPASGTWTKFAHFIPTETHRLNHTLGNLLPLSISRNSSLSRREFREKCGDNNNVKGFRSGCTCEIEVSKKDIWTAETIQVRGLEMLNFLEKRWNLGMGSKDQRLRFLGIEFLAKGEGEPPTKIHEGTSQDI